ncbi:MAG: thioesterase family protein [Burkholderiaceae bacterium]
MKPERIRLDGIPLVHAFEREALIRFAHCDPAGMVFYPQYLVILNGLIEDWVTEALGIGYGDLIGQRRIGLPTVSLQCEFLGPSLLGETCQFGLSVEHLGESSIQLALGVRRGDELRLRMRQSLVVTSLDIHRPIPIPADFRAAAELFLVPAV